MMAQCQAAAASAASTQLRPTCSASQARAAAWLPRQPWPAWRLQRTLAARRPRLERCRASAGHGEPSNGPAVPAGAKVRVTKPVTVWHAPGNKDGLNLEGMEGTVLEDVRHYKGKELSASLAYKVQLALQKEDGKTGKLLVHLDAAEFEVV